MFFAYVFSSSTGIRYVFLKEGNGQTPNLNDIVSIDYVGKNLSDVVFDTSNTQAAIDAEIYTEGRSYSPIRFNLTSNGSGLAGFVSGFLSFAGFCRIRGSFVRSVVERRQVAV